MTLTTLLRGTTATAFMFLLLHAPLSAGQGLPDFTTLVEENAPAIVNVSTVRSVESSSEEREFLEELLRRFYGDRMPGPDQDRDIPRQRERSSVGSGFIISSDGYIVTNHHVISDADEVTITLNDRREFQAEVIGSDERSDLALLKIAAEGLHPVTMAPANELKVGEWVLAIGSPFGLSYSVAAGIVSYIGRNLPTRQEVGNYVSYIQTDVAINPGHSGGPLFNLQGEVVGINSQIFTNSGGSIGLSFAIPVDVAENVIAQLRENGSVARGWMGVAIDNVTPSRAEAFNLERPRGALINQVLDGSPAQAAGFRSGDVIISFDGHEINTSGDLPYHVGLTAPGSEVDVEIIRNGRPLNLTMTVGTLEEGDQLSQAPEPEVNRIGLSVSELDESTKEELSVDNGVVVDDVQGNVAREAGFRPGDVIITINNEEIDSVEEFDAVVAELPTGRALPVLVSREGRQSFFTVRIPEE